MLRTTKLNMFGQLAFAVNEIALKPASFMLPAGPVSVLLMLY